MANIPHFCDHCGAANRETGRFCAVCGQPLQNDNSPSGKDILLPSQVLKRRYSIHSTLGRGGFGTIYRAEDLTLHHALRAIKEMRIRQLGSQEKPQAVEAFQREASLLAGLMHPHLPRIYDHFEDHGHWYLVMDFIEGETLEERVQKAPGNRLPVPQVLQFALQLCTVLNYLHTRQSPIIFRDLKPANVMATEDDHLYLIDFGIARLFKADQLKDTLALGSPGFAAPEQYGKAQTTEQADIYGLGATLHYLLSGRDPSEDPFQFPLLNLEQYPHVGQPFAQLVQRMVEMKREHRPDTVQTVKQELLRLAQLPFATRPMPAPLLQSSRFRVTPIPTSPQNINSGDRKKYRKKVVTPPVLSQSIPSLVPLLTHEPGSLDPEKLLYMYLGHEEKEHKLPIKALYWSPDSTRIASQVSIQVHIWDATTGQAYFKDGSAMNVTWSPDGERIATGNGDVKIRDARTGKVLKRWKWPAEGDWSNPAWSPNGKYLLVVKNNPDYSIYIYDALSVLGEVIAICHGHTSFIQAISWSPDGNAFASVSLDDTVEIWEITRLHPLRTEKPMWQAEKKLEHKAHGSFVKTLAWSPNGKYIAFGGLDKQVNIWDVATGERLQTYRQHTHTIKAVTWSPDSQYIASASQDGTIQIWSATTGIGQYTYTGHQGSVTGVAWSPDGTRIASGGKDQTVQVWRPTPECLPTQLPAVTPSSRRLQGPSLSITPGVEFKAVPSISLSPAIGSPDQGTQLFVYKEHKRPHNHIHSIQWSPDGTNLVSTDSTSTHIWSALTGLQYIKMDMKARWSPDGTRLLTGYTTSLDLWDTGTWNRILGWEQHSYIDKFLWSPDNKYILVLSEDRGLYVLDAISAEIRLHYNNHQTPVSAACWSPDSRFVASGDRDHTLQLWNVPQGELFLAYEKHWSFIQDIAWSPDGKYIASIGGDLHIWDATTGAMQQDYAQYSPTTIHKKGVLKAVSWSPDGVCIASTGYNDGTIEIRQALTGAHLYTYRGHTEAVHAVTWSPDATRIASGGMDAMVHVWQALPPSKSALGNR